jgi:hypothetical protein
MNHPNLSNEINSNIAKTEILGGLALSDLKAGGIVEVKTRNTTYRIEKRADGYYISGNARFCPTPIKANIHGSTWGGSMLKIDFIGYEMRLEFSTEDHVCITTTEIQGIREL